MFDFDKLRATELGNYLTSAKSLSLGLSIIPKLLKVFLYPSTGITAFNAYCEMFVTDLCLPTLFIYTAVAQSLPIHDPF
jgi:hypothetical protein